MILLILSKFLKTFILIFILFFLQMRDGVCLFGCIVGVQLARLHLVGQRVGDDGGGRVLGMPGLGVCVDRIES